MDVWYPHPVYISKFSYLFTYRNKWFSQTTLHNSPVWSTAYPFPTETVYLRRLSSPSNGKRLFYTLIPLSSWLTHLRDALFCTSHTKNTPLNHPFSPHILYNINKFNQNGGFLIPLGTHLFETPLQFSSNGWTHLEYVYTSQLLAESLFETFIFVITIQKRLSKLPIFSLIFVYLLQTLSLPIRLKDIYLKKIKDVKA